MRPHGQSDVMRPHGQSDVMRPHGQLELLESTGMVGMDLLSKVCYTKNTHCNTMEGGRKGGLDNITQPWS